MTQALAQIPTHGRTARVTGKIAKWRLARRYLMLIVGIILAGGSVAVALATPLLISLDPIRQDARAVLVPPAQNAHHVLGTDHLGRDILARLLYGARITLLIGWASVIFGGAVGLVLGLLAGYYGHLLDDIIMRIAEVKMAFPFILLVLLFMSVVFPGPTTIVGVFVFVGWPVYAKVIRSVTQSLMEEEYVMAARAIGASDKHIMLHHLLPNVLPVLFVLLPLQLAQVVFAEAGMSFIGVGVQPPNPSWGAMLSESRNYVAIAWWLVVFPGIALLLTVLGSNLLGDGLQELLDPKRKVRG